MRLLLDTSALAYWVLDAAQLGLLARQVIADADNEVWVSAVSAFEIATKHRSGKWDDIAGFLKSFEQEVAINRFNALPISTAHALLAGMMPGEHRDPFDRLLAAQAELEGMRLVSHDKKFAEFGVEVIW